MHSNIKIAFLTEISLLNSFGFFATTKFGLFLTFQISLSVPDENESFSWRAATLLPLSRRPANLLDRFYSRVLPRQRLKSFQLVSHSTKTLKSFLFLFPLNFLSFFPLSLKFTTCLVYESRRITTKNSCGVKCCCLRRLLTKHSKTVYCWLCA